MILSRNRDICKGLICLDNSGGNLLGMAQESTSHKKEPPATAALCTLRALARTSHPSSSMSYDFFKYFLVSSDTAVTIITPLIMY